MGLSPPVEAAVDEAVTLILDLIEREGQETAGHTAGTLQGTLRREESA